MKRIAVRARRTAMLALVSLLVLVPMAGHAQVPQTISYQGSLTDAKGNPLNADVEMVFRLYDSPTATTALWGEGQAVTVTNGIFSVVLGANALNPLEPALFQQPLYLGIAVNADTEMTPRQALSAAGYAVRAKGVEVDTLSALACAVGWVAKWNGSAWTCAADDVSGGTAANLVCATCVSAGELAFDTATQPELDGHGAAAAAHHTRYTDAEARAAAGPHVTSVDGLSGGAIGGSVAVNGGLLLAGQLTSTLTTGAPLSVASLDLVANLNADRLDNLQAAEIVAAAQDEVRTAISALPFTIATPGSYYLTGALTVASTTANGIMVNADDVTIDLMGFSLIGPGSGSGTGIYMSGRSNVEIRNGTVRGFGNIGIWEASSSNGHRIVNVRVVSNSSRGIWVSGEGHLVKDCTAANNVGSGIQTGGASTVTGNTVYNNAFNGILTSSGNTVTGNTAFQNGTVGILAGPGSTVIGNTAFSNQREGIVASSNNLVDGNAA